MQSVALTTVYRTSDPEHLLFLNRIRTEQPDRQTLLKSFGERHWEGNDLSEYVAKGRAIGDATGKYSRGLP